MRKSLVLLVVALLGATAPALAAVKFEGSIDYKLEGSIGTADFDAEDKEWGFTPSPGYSLTVSFDAGEEGKWSLSGELDPSNLATLSNVKLVLTPPEFKLTAVKDTDIGEVGDPFSFVVLKKLDTGTGVRVESSLFGPTVVAQVDNVDKETIGVKVETAIDPLTVGAVTRLAIPDNSGVDVVGYAKAAVAPVTVTGAFGRDKNEKTGYAAKVEVKPVPGLSANATYKKEFDQDVVVSGGATYDVDLLQPGVSYSQTRNQAGALTNRTVTGTLKYRGSADNPAFGDLFNDNVKKWYDYVAPAVSLSISQVTDTTAEPTLTVNAKAAAPIAPGLAGRVFFTYEADKDGKYDAFKESGYGGTNGAPDYAYLAGKSHLLIDSELRYKLTESVTVGPTLKVHSWGDLVLKQHDGSAESPVAGVTASGSGLDLGAKVTYAITDSASLSLSVSRVSYSFSPNGTLPAGAKDKASTTTVALTASVGF